MCGYSYVEGEQGTSFTELPNSWRCPQCLSQKGVFYAKTETIAGFAENQQYVAHHLTFNFVYLVEGGDINLVTSPRGTILSTRHHSP